MSPLGYNRNQKGRRILAAKLMALREDKPNARFEDALMAINAHFETIDTDDIETFWDRWAMVGDELRVLPYGKLYESERKRLEYMLTYLGTALEEMRELGFR